MKKFICCLMIIITCLMFVKVNASTTFYDTRGTKYEGVVERMARLGIVNGMTDKTFAPNKGITRAELAKIITKIKGIEDIAFDEKIEYTKNFKDVKNTEWYYPYVMTVADLEIINGYEDGTFKPEKEVTYAEVVAILLRNLGYTNIKEDSPNGWYWNYVVRMRDIELNDNIGEFDYTKPAKRGDVTMFVWNTLITDRWAISASNDKDGLTYTYSDTTQLEMFFEGYSFLDNIYVPSIGGNEEEIIIYTSRGTFFTKEKTPLYVAGGNITALYNKESKELIGVTFDEDYPNIEVVNGPTFYLKAEGYNLSRTKKEVNLGYGSDSNYAYIVINKETDEILRVVYLKPVNNIYINSVSVKETEIEGARGMIKDITINEDKISSSIFALYEEGFAKNINSIKKGDIITSWGNGLYITANKKITGEMIDYNSSNDRITIDSDEYIVADECLCSLYKEDDPIKFSSLSRENLKEYIGTEITVTLNIAEEICKIDFGKTDADNQRYKVGFVTAAYYRVEENIQSIRVDYGEDKTRIMEIKIDNNSYADIGDLASIDDKGQFKLIDKDTKFDNDISVKYDYDAKKFSYPMIGEYIVTKETKYYKVNMEYENNSITKIKSCKTERLDIDENIDDLAAYKLILVYNENMEVIKVYAINEINKFENQIAIIRDFKTLKKDGKKTYKATLSVMGEPVRGYEVTENIEDFESGDIITFTYTGNDDTRTAKLEEVFKKEFIGYKRDLVVKSFDNKTNIITFTDGSTMDLNKDIYNFSGTKINLNRYRFIIAKVSDGQGHYKFNSLEMYKKEKLPIKEGDRFAIGELQDVIVIYRGYEE